MTHRLFTASTRGFLALACVLAVHASGQSQAVAERAGIEGENSLSALANGPSHNAIEEVSATLPSAPSAMMASRTESEAGGSDERVSLRGLPKRVVLDELGVVTSPARLRKQDLKWLLPLAGASAAAFATDSRAMRDVVSRNPSFNASSGTASDVLRDGFIGVPAALFAVGELGHDDKSREAGVLAGEAAIDAYAFGAVVKVITLRDRPLVNNANGAFFQTGAGWDSSFPSGHTIVAWSSAAVLAGEYDKPWQQAGIYTAAAGVSLTRMMAQQHFPSDVLIGSAAGWLIGHYVYRKHHVVSKR